MADWGAGAGARIRAVPLNVLVFGPSPSHAQGEKRVQIRDAIRERNPADRVAFPEDIIAADPDLEALVRVQSAYAVERLLIDDADAVVVLLIEDPFATGAVTELAQFLTEEALRGRFFVIEPHAFRRLAERTPPPYTFELLSRLHAMQRFAYDAAQLATCTAIRRAVDEWLLQVRLAKLQGR